MITYWARGRERLFYLLVSDLIIVILSYNICFLLSTGQWAHITGSVVLSAFVFTLFSYIVGRYSFGGEPISVPIIIKKALIATTATVCLLVVIAWSVEARDIRAQKGFVLPAAAINFTSTISVQCLLCIDKINQMRKIYIVSNNEKGLLAKRELDSLSSDTISIFYARSVDNALISSIIAPRNTVMVLDDDIELPPDILELILDYRASGMIVMNIKQFFENRLKRLPPEFITTKWFSESTSVKMMPGYIDWRLKRFIDCCGALGLLLLTLPIQIIAVMLIKLEDGGPVFFTQIRTGLYGKPFKIWKLRSMKNTDNNYTQWSFHGDQRVTFVGKLIRSARVDELPQLYNVLRGDMSLIGPRPEQPNIEVELEKIIKNYRLRHMVRPGISGWAQTCYGYGSCVEDSRIKLSYDLYYIRHCSWLLDLLITLKTIKQVVILRGL